MIPLAPLFAQIAAMQNAPRQWCVTTYYADGTSKRHDTATESQAENWATGERRKIGRELLDRETGETVRVVRVTVRPLLPSVVDAGVVEMPRPIRTHSCSLCRDTGETETGICWRCGGNAPELDDRW